MVLFLYIALGVLAGFLSGILGIGGGIVIIPALVFLFGLSQKMAQGTTLALLVPPIGLLAAYAYYKQGFVDVKIAALICVGFVLGSYFGAGVAIGIPGNTLQRIFGVALFIISIKMMIGK